MDENRNLMVDVHRQDSSSISGSLASVSVGSANQRLTLRASGCLESLTAVEVSAIVTGGCTLTSTQYDTFKSCCFHRHGFTT